MQIASTISTPNRPVFQVIRAATVFRRSPLNPQRRSLVSAVTLKNTIATAPNRTHLVQREKLEISTREHLFNLERLLQKGSQPSPKPQPENDSGEVSPENKGKRIFEGLNLGEIWPARSKAEEMSPRNLNRLQRLLSKSPQYSPRNYLGDRWQEYHGKNDWAGLLDPLDENLRREVVRYGEFIQAAYHAFHSNPATSADEPSPSPRHVALPDRSYKVTKSLYATSSVGLPSWVDDVAPDLGWMTQRSSWIGYVAVCENEREIARMGRRDIVISFRGTSTCLEWAENMRAVLVKTSEDANNKNVQSKVECGFWSLYKTPGAQMPSLSDAVVEEVRRLVHLYKGERLSITVTGHSLGAALALLTADELSTCGPDIPPVAVFSFGGPHVGNRGFADRIKANGVKVLRVVNTHDVITKVPGVFVGEGADQKQSGNGNIAQVLNDMPLAYSHVGTELRVDSKTSPYLKPNADVACCHDLEAYLHLVDGFIASNCPFRANAKRSIAKLLNEQGSNVKKLYTSKALTMSLDKMGSPFYNKS